MLMDVAGVSWGNILTILGIILASWFSYQASKRAAAEAQDKVLSLHTQNIEKMVRMETMLKIVFEWMQRQQDGTPHRQMPK